MTLITFSDGKVVMKGDAVGTEQACCCGGGACCHCRRDLYYFGFSPTASESRTITVNSPAGLWLFGPAGFGIWQCQNILDQDGNFSYKYCYTGGSPCRFANYVWDNATNLGAQGDLSEWFRLDERNICLNTGEYVFLPDCAECEQCRDLDEGDSVEVLVSKLQDLCGGCCEGLTCADIEEVDESGFLVTPCTIGDCNPLP